MGELEGTPFVSAILIFFVFIFIDVLIFGIIDYERSILKQNIDRSFMSNSTTINDYNQNVFDIKIVENTGTSITYDLTTTYDMILLDLPISSEGISFTRTYQVDRVN